LKKQQAEAWAGEEFPVLVEKNRRSSKTGGSMLQKAMELKQKKNLDQNKGNSFSVLHNDTLNNTAVDVNMKIGNDVNDKNRIIDILVQSEKDNYEHFVEENPDILLPTDIDVQVSLESDRLKGGLEP
jgi:hypothetical protein